MEKGSFPTSHEAIQVFPFFGMCCHRSVDREALALLLGTPRLQQEICSFHSLNIIQVLIIKAGWNSMSRIDDSTPLIAGSSLARSARQTHTMHAASTSHQPSFQMRHIYFPIPRPWILVRKARIRARSSYVPSHPPNKLIQWQSNVTQTNTLIQWQNNLLLSQEVKTVQNCNKRALR